MTHREADKLSDAELRAILLTVDGMLKAEKEIALEALLERAYDKGWDNGAAEAPRFG